MKLVNSRFFRLGLLFLVTFVCPPLLLADNCSTEADCFGGLGAAAVAAAAAGALAAGFAAGGVGSVTGEYTVNRRSLPWSQNPGGAPPGCITVGYPAGATPREKWEILEAEKNQNSAAASDCDSQ